MLRAFAPPQLREKNRKPKLIRVYHSSLYTVYDLRSHMSSSMAVMSNPPPNTTRELIGSPNTRHAMRVAVSGSNNVAMLALVELVLRMPE